MASQKQLTCYRKPRKGKHPRPDIGVPKGRRFEQWIEVRARFGLSHSEIQMARELSLSPANIKTYVKRHFKKGWPRLDNFIPRRYRNVFGIVLSGVPSLEEQREAAKDIET